MDKYLVVQFDGSRSNYIAPYPDEEMGILAAGHLTQTNRITTGVYKLVATVKAAPPPDPIVTLEEDADA